jgi:hypothetical protein
MSPSSKQKVHYDPSKGVTKIGESARLFPIDHPDTERVTNSMHVITSRVIHWDHSTGVIETMNSIYTPLKKGTPHQKY